MRLSTKRRYMPGLGLLLAVSVAAAVVGLWPRQPKYNGRTLSSWAEDLDLEKPDRIEEAQRAVRAIGTNAFPFLLKMLTSEEPIWERGINLVERHQSVLRFRLTPAGAIRYRAVLAYAALGAAAKDGVPALIELMKSDRSPPIRASVACALGAIGPAAEAAAQVLSQASQDPDPQVRRNALLALVNIQRSADGGRGTF